MMKNVEDHVIWVVKSLGECMHESCVEYATKFCAIETITGSPNCEQFIPNFANIPQVMKQGFYFQAISIEFSSNQTGLARKQDFKLSFKNVLLGVS